MDVRYISLIPEPERAASMPRRRFLVTGLAGLGLSVFPLPALAVALDQFAASGTGGIGHDAFDAIVSQYVKTDGEGYNRVDYAALKAEATGDLKAYIATLEAATPSQFSAEEAHAYWINLYNAKTLDVVVDAYPVASIKDIRLGGSLFKPGPWSKPILTVEGTEMSLDDIEHRIVRPLFDDPLSHYALNCASVSCPNLAVRAYTADNKTELMEESARLYVNHPRGLAISDGKITASRLYQWYADDFGGKDALKPHWEEFLAAAKAGEVEKAVLFGYAYDWALNDV